MNEKPTQFNSPIFGPTRTATKEEREIIAAAVRETPVAIFQAFNKLLNEMGMCCLISKMEE